MLFVVCYLFLKAIAFFELLVAISFFIFLTVLISAMGLLISVVLKLGTLNYFENTFTSFMLYLKRRVFSQKGLLFFFKLIYDMPWNGCYQRLKKKSDIANVLKITIFPSSVRFLIFHIFSNH